MSAKQKTVTSTLSSKTTSASPSARASLSLHLSSPVLPQNSPPSWSKKSNKTKHKKVRKWHRVKRGVGANAHNLNVYKYVKEENLTAYERRTLGLGVFDNPFNPSYNSANSEGRGGTTMKRKKDKPKGRVSCYVVLNNVGLGKAGFGTVVEGMRKTKIGKVTRKGKVSGCVSVVSGM